VVSGCPYKDRNDPGNLQFDWLEVQLDTYRKEGLQVRMMTLSVINNDPDESDIKGLDNWHVFFGSRSMRQVWLIDNLCRACTPNSRELLPRMCELL